MNRKQDPLMNTETQQHGKTDAVPVGTGEQVLPLEREERMWWAVTEFGVQHVNGYSCAPTNPDMWWCPRAGFSMQEGYHLFKTEAEALDKKIDELERLLTETNERLTAFRLQRQNSFGEPTPDTTTAKQNPR